VEIQKGNDDLLRGKRSCKSVDITYPGAKEPTTHKVIRGKEGKFHNRKRPKGWLPPSGKQLIDITMVEIRQTAKILPVSHICLERVSFDFQKLENEDIQAWGSARGLFMALPPTRITYGKSSGERVFFVGSKGLSITTISFQRKREGMIT